MQGLSGKNARVLGQVALAALSLLLGPRAVGATPRHEVHTILIQGMSFVPNVVVVHAHDRVVWKNDDLVPHTVTAEDKSVDSKAIKQGRSWSHILSKKGQFPYSCTFHPTMKGLIIVK